MSATGQKRSSRPGNPTSAIPPEADIARQTSHVRKVPKSDIARAWLKTKVSDPVVLPNGRKLGHDAWQVWISLDSGSRVSGCAKCIQAGRCPRMQIFSQFFPAIQSRICVDATVFFGVWGFKVPAIALQPSLIISWANCLASASVLNLRVARANLRPPSSRLGVMFAR
jgi:hypothetical protein